MARQENEKKLVLTVGGRMLYPKKEEGKTKYALQISTLAKQNLDAKVKEMYPQYTLSIKEDENESGMYLLNVKTCYDVPIFDKDKNKIETSIYHGAEVYASIVIKEYHFMGKTGITTYLSGIVLLENGEASGGQSFDSIMNNMI